MLNKFAVQILLIIHIFTGRSFAEDIRDIQPPVTLPPNYFLLYLLAAILAAAGFFFLIRCLIKHSRKPKTETVLIKLPWEIAIDGLEELKSRELPSQGIFKEYYILLSGIIRKYIEDRFKIKAPEMTTQEFLTYLKKSNDFKSDDKKLLEDFLNWCDMVKFAKYSPTLNEAEESFNFAKIFISKTRE